MQEYKFNFTQEEADTIIEGLLELKGKICIPIINKLRFQFEDQVKLINHPVPISDLSEIDVTE